MYKALVRLVSICQPFWLIMAIVLFMIGLGRAGSLIITQLSGSLIDALAKGSAHAATQIIVTIGLILIADLALGVVRWYTETRKLINPMRGHVLTMVMAKLNSLSISQHRSEHSGIRKDVVSKGQEAVHSIATMMILNVVPLVIELGLVVGMLIWTDIRIGGAFLVGAACYVLCSLKMNNNIFPELENLRKTERIESKHRGEILSNIALVITTGQEDRAIHESEESRSKSYHHFLEVWTPYINKVWLRDMILVATRMVTSSIAAWLALRHEITVGQTVAVLALANSALSQIHSTSSIWRALLSDTTSLAKLLEVLDTETDVPTPLNPIRPERFLGNIACHRLMLIYRGKDGKISKSPSLKDVTFSIKAGQRVAIIGRSGAGKSTLIHALLRGQELDAGTITIDGIDIRQLDPIHWRRRLGVVLQMPFLFDDTLRYNLTFDYDYKRTLKVSDEELYQACLMASLDDLLPRLAEGFKTKIGERGIRLSGGEQQRVAIARALIKKPDILIFDEATSNLDPDNEERIRLAIQRAGAGRTTIIIAHRFSTIRDADVVLVMEQGHLVDQGTHQELSQRSPVYQQLVLQHQMADRLIGV